MVDKHLSANGTLRAGRGYKVLRRLCAPLLVVGAMAGLASAASAEGLRPAGTGWGVSSGSWATPIHARDRDYRSREEKIREHERSQGYYSNDDRRAERRDRQDRLREQRLREKRYKNRSSHHRRHQQAQPAQDWQR